ncbi:hypothetical protein MTO96_014928 [Rhipicephalus appendiculatus]
MTRRAVLIWCLYWLPHFGGTLSQVHRGENGSGPRLVLEPQSVVRFSSETGAVLPCSAEGRPVPAVTWEMSDGSPASDISGLRETRPDGSLVLRSFGPSLFRPEIHSATYRCVASNALGLVKSRLVHVRGVVAENFVPVVQDVYAIRRNAAVLRCHLPAAVKDYITVVSWIRSDGVVVGSRGTAGQPGAEGRYAMLPTGELVARGLGATASEAFYTYRMPGAQFVHRTNTSQRHRGKNRRHWAIRPPVYSWFRVTERTHKGPTVDSGLGGDVIPLRSSDRMLLRFAPLSARIESAAQVVDAGRSVNVTCRVSGQPVHGVLWTHNGRPLFAASSGRDGIGGDALTTASSARVRLLTRDVLRIVSAKRQDSGMYQCLAFNGDDSAQGSVEIIVREDAPVLNHVFSELLVVPGSSVSLRCAASGNPLPQVTWTLDGDSVPESYNVRVGDYVSSERLVHSYVNLTGVRVEDGGLYACEARNSAGPGLALGSPNCSRQARAATTDGQRHGSGRSQHGPTLSRSRTSHSQRYLEERWTLATTEPPPTQFPERHAGGEPSATRGQDSGTYGCTATDPDGNMAGGELTVRVMSLTMAEAKGSDMTNAGIQRGSDESGAPERLCAMARQGKRAGAACIVSDGDPPISIAWLKDGGPLDETALGATVSRTNDYTSFLSIAAVRQKAHSGLYTCVASNPAASANRSATMVVRVGPRWRHRPEDKAATMGQPVTFDCQADGFPVPVIRWKKERLSEDGGRQFATITSSARVRVLENGTLAIDDVDRSDAGRYLCQSQNGVGPGVSTVVKLDVHVAAYFVEKFKAVTVRRGDSASLECRAQGDPSIDISWSRDGRRFDPSQEPRYAVEKNTGSSWSESVLRITGADRRDSSLFGCRAENAYGVDDASFRLIIQEPPDKVAGLEPTHISSRTVTLTWSAPYSGNSPLLKYLLEQRTLSGTWEREVDISTAYPTEGGLSHLVQGLQPSTNYEFRVRAGNALGLGDFSDPIIVTTKQEAPSGSPQDIKVTPAGSRSLYVTWKPPSEEDKYGGVQGYYVGYRVWGSGQPYLYKTLESRLPSSSPSQLQQCILSELRPRTRYGIVVQAFNADGAGPSSDEIVAHTPDVGRGPRSNVVLAKTDGSVPVAPDLRELLVANPTRAVLRLTAWKSGGCPITSFTVLHRRHSAHDHWDPPVTVHAPDVSELSKLPQELVIRHLTPATRYQLLVTAHSEAGSTHAEYVFATPTLSEGALSATHWTEATDLQRRSVDVIVPVLCTVLVTLLGAVVVGYAMSRRRLAALRRRRLVWRPGDGTSSSDLTRKSVEAVPMCEYEKPVLQEQQHDVSASRSEQLYLPSPFGPRMLPCHMRENSAGRSAYDVPFAPRDSVQKLAERDDLLASAERLTTAKQEFSQAQLISKVEESTGSEAHI